MVVCSPRLGLIATLSLAVVSGCASLDSSPGSRSLAVEKLPEDAAVAAAVFGPNGRLWRLIVADQALYVDTSYDGGASYGAAVAVTPHAQPILARAEDRPSIAVDAQGGVYVVYTAGAHAAPVTYLAYSADGGRQFNAPLPVRDPADHSRHYQASMIVAPAGQLYVFWNDERGKEPAAAERHGAALYYATGDRPAMASLSNRKLAEGLCNCCRLDVDLDVDGLPVVLARFVYPGQVRDHGMLKASPAGLLGTPWRVTEDDWQIEACPMHGPALSIARDGRFHIAWFTQGRRRQGLFYAHSDDRGLHFSAPMALGRDQGLHGHADILALNERVVLVWHHFDGNQNHIVAMQSYDRGATWSAPVTVAQTGAAADHPFLISNDRRVFLSWNSTEHGHRLIPID